MINPTAQSNRTGGPIAAAWAMLRFLGEAGFQNIVRKSQAATRQMLESIEGMEGIRVLGDPEMCMFTIISDELNVFEIDDEMRLRGWQMIPQFACGGGPANLHVSLSEANVPHTQLFIKDLQEVVASLRQRGPGLDQVELARIADEAAGKPVEEVMMAIIPVIGLTGTDLPERMAPLNTILDRLPAGLRDELLTAYFNMVTGN